MIDRKTIELPVKEEFNQFKETFSSSLKSEILTIQDVLHSVQRTSGKHFRPLLLLLTAKACGVLSSTSITTAVLLEKVHTASLLHDDVVDETAQRRGKPSINALYDNKLAVLVGDYILSDALISAVSTGNTAIVSIVANLCKEMAEGEIKQLENVKQIILHEEDYFIAIEKKTGTLLASCTEIGALSVNASPEIQAICRRFGMLLGYCFQIKDDIFDYYQDHQIGKPSGNDIREGKVSLPLLYALQQASPEEKERFISILTLRNFTHENIAALIQFAKEKGGVTYAEKRMQQFNDEAIKEILLLPKSSARDSLCLLAEYLIERTK